MRCGCEVVYAILEDGGEEIGVAVYSLVWREWVGRG